jgi:cob(I)alamin adenosyltransferase
MALHQEAPVEAVIIVFLNRLSDYLFVLSRWIAFQLGIEEIKWNPRNE